MCKNGLAVAYKSAGRIADAIKLYETTLAALESTLGPDHPDTIATRNNLATAYRSTGRKSDTVKLYEAALRQLESKLGPDHALTMTIRGNLIAAYHSAGRISLAIKLLEAQESNLRPDRTDAQTAKLSIMRRYFQLGAFEKALPHYLQHYQSCLREHGARHIETILARRDLAEVYSRLGRYDDAEPLFVRSLTDLEDRPRNDPIVVLTEKYLENMYKAWGKTDTATEWRVRLGSRFRRAEPCKSAREGY